MTLQIKKVVVTTSEIFTIAFIDFNNTHTETARTRIYISHDTTPFNEYRSFCHAFQVGQSRIQAHILLFLRMVLF